MREEREHRLPLLLRYRALHPWSAERGVGEAPNFMPGLVALLLFYLALLLGAAVAVAMRALLYAH